MLLLLAQDLQLEEELLLLQEPGIRGVHGGLAGVVLLVWGNVLVVLELLHPGFGLFALLAAALLRGGLLLTLLLKGGKARLRRGALPADTITLKGWKLKPLLSPELGLVLKVEW